jgi:hypothetical protein
LIVEQFGRVAVPDVVGEVLAPEVHLDAALDLGA